MHSFDLYLPTRLVFGRGRVSELPRLMEGRGKRVLIVYGGGSVKRTGLLDRVKAALSGFEVSEFSGIEPNPKIGTIRRAVGLCREKGIEVLLAVGGGSVLDATKAIAAGVSYEGDTWDLVLDHSKIGRALPIFTVLTTAATGSEYDAGGVISNPETDEKLPIMSPALFPVASVMEPEDTFTVPAFQTAAGAADIMSHTFESYIVKDGNELTDGFCEAMLRTVIENAPKAIANPGDEDARASLMMASSFGCCGLLSIGRTPSPWPCHGIEHEISAWYDITHGEGLAIITPHWMRYTLSPETAYRFTQYGVRVWGLDPKAGEMENARRAIDLTAEFFRKIGLHTRLSELGIDEAHFGDMADHVLKHWWPLGNAFRPIDRDGVIEILRASL